VSLIAGYNSHMPTSDPLTILLAHDQWATKQMLDACAKLTTEQFHQRFEMGCGSLHDNLTHMLSAMKAWTQTLSGQTPGPRMDMDGQSRSLQDLLSLQETIAAGFVAEAHRLPLDGVVTRTRDGRTMQFTRGAVLMQVTTHAMHHRAQCLNMLRQLGVKPLPLSSVAEWTWAADAK
jgi:uncharacterized damage-inducible protein DinB